MKPPLLRITSCMADNAEATCRAITLYLDNKLGIATEFVDCIPWQERERQLDAGLIHMCWICGLPYVGKTDADDSVIEIRVIGTLGPSPMPPWVMLKSLAPELRAGLRDTLLAMHADAAGARILAQWGIAHFTVVDDAAYNPIRDMARQAEGIRLAA